MVGKKFDNRKWQDGGISSFSETCFAEYWDELPVLNEVNSVDPYNFMHRMAMGKLVIENTGSVWGENFEEHWLWAYLAQLDWQRRSGRLSDPFSATRDNENDPKISKDSWFGYMNTNFLVTIYRAAANLGLVDDVNLSKECGIDVESDPAFIKCVDIWTSFLSGPHKEFLDNHLSKKLTKEKGLNAYYKKLWEAHTDTIETSIQYSKRMENLLPEIERKFSLGFCRVPEMLQAMSWTYLGLDSLMKVGIGYLPSVFLMNEDALKSLKKDKPNEYNTTMDCINYSTASPGQLKIIFGLFRRLARWKIERQRMPQTMKILGNVESSNIQKMAVSMRVLVKIAMPKSSLEILLWTLLIAGIVGLFVGSMYW